MTEPQGKTTAAEPGSADAFPRETVHALRVQIDQLQRDFGRYAATQVDLARRAIRSATLFIMVAAGALVMLVCTLAIGIFAAIHGLAGGLSVLFGDRLWLGELSAGAIAILAPTLGGLLLWKLVSRHYAREALRKYPKRRSERETARANDAPAPRMDRP